jgi:glycosyltransferase 2 family protein
MLNKYKFILQIAVSLFLISYLITFLDWDRVMDLEPIVWSTLFGGVLFVLATLSFMAVRWRLLIEYRKNQKVEFSLALKGYLLGGFFNIFMPGSIGGDLMRIKYMADKAQINLKESGLLVLIERIIGLTALGFIFIVGAVYSFDMHEKYFSFNYLLIIIMLLPVLVYIKYKVSTYVSLNYFRYLLVFFLSVAAHISDVILVYFFMFVLDINLNFSFLLFIMPLVYIATIIPISLGGLGVREATMSGLLVLFSIEPSQGVLVAFMLYLSKVLAGILGSKEAMSFMKVNFICKS